MKRFARLFQDLDATTSTLRKVEVLREYFQEVSAADAAWTLYFLTGQRLKRFIPHGLLSVWIREVSSIPDWLLEESYASVGDLAETIALLAPPPEMRSAHELSLSAWMTERILPLRGLPPEEQREAVVTWWRSLPSSEVFILNKLLTGAFRVGVSQTLVIRALAELAGLDRDLVTHRLTGHWEPTAESFRALLSHTEEQTLSKPYPFFLASPLDREFEALSSFHDWQLEWKWDGIRAQLIRREGQTFIWSRGEELVTDRFPELVEAAHKLPDGTVLDGEILAFTPGGEVAPFALLQQRIGRKKLTPKILKDVPVRLITYDLLEWKGKDIRGEPLSQRRAELEQIVSTTLPVIGLSEIVVASNWEEAGKQRSSARERGVEGLMIKKKDSIYETGRRRGDWWKWKVDPLTIDAVLIYAQAGSGRRANLFTDYTFAIWKDSTLVPLAKAYSGLTDQEILELDRWIRAHTLEKFGPVRSVQPLQVFELAFEGIQKSTRHKSGFAVRFPRILRWRKDKPPEEADRYETVEELLRTEIYAARA